ncbi:MAG: hypothetical protein MUF70_01600 [Myxococcota bacterium]|nr:hypothetical protein [Myxococcota bacterium]
MNGARPSWRSLAILFAVATLAVAVLYGRTLDHQLVWMDETEIGEAAIVLAPGVPWSSAFTRPLHASAQGVNPYYRPLQILVATAVHRAAGPTPRVYRAVLFAAAIGTAFAFGALALHLFANLPLAIAAMAVAIAHPAMIESWVWISGLGEALAGFFTIASVACAALALDRGPRARLWTALSVAALALGLLSKEKAVVVPALVAALWLSQRLATDGVRGVFADRAASRRALLLVGALVAGVALYLVARPILMGRGLVAASPIGGDRVTHLLSAVASWSASMGWLAAPLHSTTSDAVDVVRSFGDGRVLAGALLPLATLGLALVAALRGRPVAAFGLAWVWIAFLPTSNLFPQIHARAERYLFLSAFGYALVLVDVFRAIAARIHPGAAVAAATAGALVVTLGFAQRTWVRSSAWQSTETLFRADLARDPGFREGRFHLANALVASGRFAEAEAELRALRAPAAGERSGYVNAIGVERLTCATELGLGRPAQVSALLDRLERERSPAAQDPGVRTCAAQALEAMGRTQEAASRYEQVVASLGGAEPPAGLSLALARTHAKLGHRTDARQWLDRARASGPRETAFDFQLMQVEKLLR